MSQNIVKLEQKANAGDCDAQVQLADIYVKGHLVANNYTKAIAFFEQAAAQGNIHAVDMLG